MNKFIRAALLGLLLIEGFVLMGFEILSSRYLHPFFGSGIDTWATIISMFLLAMMCGYFIGGLIADRATSMTPLIVGTAISSCYLIVVAVAAKDVLLWMIRIFEHGPFLLMTGTAIIVFVPVFLMSIWSPYLVRVLLIAADHGGRVAGTVYGIATLGNVLGALFTAYWLIPHLGTFSITLLFAMLLALLAIATLILRTAARRVMGIGRNTMVLWLGTCLTMLLLGTQGEPASADSVYPADYPEGIFFDKSGDLYFTEMVLGTVRIISGDVDRVFWQTPDCGPTGITRLGDGRFAVACHLQAAVVILDEKGQFQQRLTHSEHGEPLIAPNDISADGQGGAYLSDSGVFSNSAPPTGKIYHLSKGLHLTKVLSTLHYSNGVAIDQKSKALYVSEHLASRILKLEINTAEPPKIWFDFSKDEQLAELMLEFAGPDGLRVLQGGGLIVALYGTGQIAFVSPCQELTLLHGFNQYVTSVGVLGTSLAVASSKSNTGPPFEGDVRVLELNFRQGCSR